MSQLLAAPKNVQTIEIINLLNNTLGNQILEINKLANKNLQRKLSLQIRNVLIKFSSSFGLSTLNNSCWRHRPNLISF